MHTRTSIAVWAAFALGCACAAPEPQHAKLHNEPQSAPASGPSTSAVPSSSVAKKDPPPVPDKPPKPLVIEGALKRSEPSVVVGVPGSRNKVPASLKALVAKTGNERVIVEVALPQPWKHDPEQRSELDEQDANIASAAMRATQHMQGPALALRPIRRVPFFAMNVGTAELDALEASSDVVSVRRNLRLRPIAPAAAAPSAAPAVIDDAIALVGATASQANGWDGDGWHVVVIDVGVDDDHSFLPGTRVAGGSAVYGNGAVELMPGPATLGRPRLASPECHPSHGTTMATIVCGESTNYGKGVAPHAQLISIRVDDDMGVINTEDVAWALVQVWLDWEPTHRIAAVNLSLAANPDKDTLATNDCIDPSPLLALLIDLLSIDGIPVVAGTGNDSLDDKVPFPACFALTFAVGATNKLDGIEGYSNSSDALDLLAPGTGVTIPSTSGFCELKAGTSVSTAFVSAAFALLRERWPTRSLVELEAALKQSGPSLTDQPNGIVRKRLDVSAAMQLLETIPPGGPQ